MTTADPSGGDCYRPAVHRLNKYVAGYTTEQVQRELGLTDLVKLASNENPWGPSPRALAAIRGELHNLWQYPEQSFFDLKKVLARANGVGPENVVVGHGSEVIIQLIPQLLCNPGDEVIVPDLTYGRYAEAATLMDARVLTVPLRSFEYDLAGVRAAVTDRTKLIWICSPNNPTGTIVRRRETEELLTGLPRDVHVVFDQAYTEFVDDGEYADGLDFLKQGHENVLVLRTFSKAYGLAGMRLGYALADREWLRDCVAQTIAGRRHLTRRLTDMGYAVVPSQANFILIDVGEDAEALWGRLLRRGIIVRPATGWGLDHHVRVTVGTAEQNERFLEALALEARRPDSLPRDRTE